MERKHKHDLEDGGGKQNPSLESRPAELEASFQQHLQVVRRCANVWETSAWALVAGGHQPLVVGTLSWLLLILQP